MKNWIKTTLFAFLIGTFGGPLSAQAPAASQGILPLAVKVQAYSPLSNLALPFMRRKEDLPFSPRFYVVEVEKYFRGGHGVQLSLGARSHDEKGLRRNAFDESSGIKGRLSYQKYFQHVEKSAFAGWFLTAGLTGLAGQRDWSDGVDQFGNVNTKMVGMDIGFGNGFTIGKYLLIQVSAGPLFGYQRNKGYLLKPDLISNFDYLAISIAEKSNENLRTFLGISGYLSCSVGWKFGI